MKKHSLFSFASLSLLAAVSATPVLAQDGAMPSASVPAPGTELVGRAASPTMPAGIAATPSMASPAMAQPTPTTAGAVLLPNGTMSDGSIPTPEVAAQAAVANAEAMTPRAGVPIGQDLQGMQAPSANGMSGNAMDPTAVAPAASGMGGAMGNDGVSPRRRPGGLNANQAAGADGAAAAPVEPPVTEFAESFFFSDEEIQKIRQAVAGRLTQEGEAASYNIPAVRKIILSGIYYRGPGDWTIWMNGKKVTPKTLLPEIVDIQVVDNRILLKWFDIGLNGIITLEMRPHQVYDIVTGVMLKE